MISSSGLSAGIKLRLLVAAAILVGATGTPLCAQSAGRLEIERGRTMLKTIKSDIEKNYYDPAFRGIDLEAVFKETDEAIKKADSNGQIFGLIACAHLLQ